MSLAPPEISHPPGARALAGKGTRVYPASKCLAKAPKPEPRA